ncbi:MAG TPA: prepilin-type N-terminal cleavage/methylation domain-containing protein [Isosphaeraceae bacterium]|jgi:general secretion pathway protein G|nr:prepilin-type N-terminal cleavage/methylation domain-containing protein [Isosphaeraceae bacterium]
MNRPRARCRSRGFTLIELLVVILILAILIALLLPAIMRAITTAKEGAQTAEISNLGNALADFKSQYGDYPPSRIILMENGAYDTTGTTTAVTWFTTTGIQPPLSATDITYATLAQRSVKYLRKFFPRAIFGTTNQALYTQAFFHDFNGDGMMQTNPILLEGHEALVFFLGGIANRSGTATNMSGFSKLPTNPFISPSATIAGANNRQAPFYEFPSNRLADDDGDGMPGYLDSLDNSSQRYLAYFSSYGGGSYDPNDMNVGVVTAGSLLAPELSPTTLNPISRAFQVTFPVNPNSQTPNWLNSPPPNPYTNGPPVPLTGVVGPPTIFQNPESYQIISTGLDRFYGVGGQFNSNSTGERLTIDDAAAAWNTGDNLDPSIRQLEADNLTNFSNRRLD